MISVNGKTLSIRENASLLDVLIAQGYRLEVIAVELNGAIINKEAYGATLLHEGDKLEVVSFVGGG